MLPHSSEGFSLQTCDAAETEGLVPTPAAQGLVEQSPDLVIARCQHQGCVLPWEATFHIKSTFPYHTTSQVRDRNIALANTTRTIPMLQHLQGNQSGLNKSTLSHSMSQTLLAPSLPRLPLLPQQSHILALLGRQQGQQEAVALHMRVPGEFHVVLRFSCALSLFIMLERDCTNQTKTWN